MRALNLAIVVLVISLSLSTVNEAMGQQAAPSPVNITGEEIRNATRIGMDPVRMLFDMGGMLVSGVGRLLHVLAGAALLGDTLASLSPYTLPGSLTAGLNLLGSISMLLAVLQFMRGINLRGAE